MKHHALVMIEIEVFEGGTVKDELDGILINHPFWLLSSWNHWHCIGCNRRFEPTLHDYELLCPECKEENA